MHFAFNTGKKYFEENFNWSVKIMFKVKNYKIAIILIIVCSFDALLFFVANSIQTFRDWKNIICLFFATWVENDNGFGADDEGGVPGISLFEFVFIALLASFKILAIRSSEPSGPNGKLGGPRCWSSEIKCHHSFSITIISHCLKKVK